MTINANVLAMDTPFELYKYWLVLKEEVRSIFIDEASDIIERLDIDIISYEEDPSNNEILNGLFRGVHTLI